MDCLNSREMPTSLCDSGAAVSQLSLQLIPHVTLLVQLPLQLSHLELRSVHHVLKGRTKEKGKREKKRQNPVTLGSK